MGGPGSGGPSMAAKKQQALSIAYNGGGVKEILHFFDITEGALRKWRKNDQEFDTALKEAFGIKQSRGAYSKDGPIIFDPNREVPLKGTFAEWRQRYLGRPTLPQHRAIVDAMLDTTNNRTLILGPPGMGKDTTVADAVAYIKCDDREALRVAWLMKTENFSKRRVNELLRPLFESYRPQGEPGSDTPGSSRPASSIAADYGPFKWEANIYYEDGSQVPKRRFTQSEMFFLDSAEHGAVADPDIWASGVDGQLYGARVGLMVISDLWDEQDRNPEKVQHDLEWVTGTAASRLDNVGRMVVIGTRLYSGDGYEGLENWMVPEGTAIYEQSVNGPVTTTKYVNGACIIHVRAIYEDEEGNEVSYWPSRYPVDESWRMPDGTMLPKDALTISEAREAGASHARSLSSIRDNPKTVEQFYAMYQQQPMSSLDQADFDDLILGMCDDPSRTYGRAKSGEILVQVVDPARTDGCAWIILAVNMVEETITVLDHEWMKNQGVRGIKQNLVIGPALKYMPSFIVYESNHEQGIMFDAEVEKTLTMTGAQKVLRHTDNKRNDPEIGIASITREMADRRIRFPMMEPRDRAKTHKLKTQLKNWDRLPKSGRKNQARHSPDDLAMALGIGVQFIRELFDRKGRHESVRTSAVQTPAIVRRGWTPAKQGTKLPNDPYRGANILDLIGTP